MIRISVSLSDEAHLALVARAGRERRPVATMAAVILEAELAAEPPPLEAEPEPVLEESTGAGSASSGGDQRPPAAAPPPPPKRKKRTAMCEHRIPPEQFCKRCDDE